MGKYEYEDYCRAMANRFLPYGPEEKREEVAAVARAALILARERYDPAKGAFLTYATYGARHAIMRAWSRDQRAGVTQTKRLTRVKMPERPYVVDEPTETPDDFWPRVYAILPYRQMQVVYLLYRLGVSEAEAGRIMSVSASYVWELKDRALKRLRIAYPAMEDYLG